MSKTLCPRSFEAEALRDGRLTGSERASFETHLQKCADCAKEARALEDLARRLRELPANGSGDLHVRRERTRVLSSFNDALIEPKTRSISLWLALLPIAAAVVALAFFRHHAGRATAADVRVDADPGAAWSEHVENNRQIVELDRGTLSIEVLHEPGSRPLLVRLPDGELEDTGTTFRVSVENGKTTSVNVAEGSVVLRIAGAQTVALARGGSWSANWPAPLPIEIPSSPTSSAAPEIIDAGVPSIAVVPKASAAPLTTSASAHAPNGDDGADFRDATSALDRGEACEAASRFARYVTAHPNDARTEDAAYLRVLALQRCGDAAATKDAARDYLSRFPTGFRRAELESLAL